MDESLRQSAEAAANAVYKFLKSCATACAQLNSSLTGVSPLPIQQHTIPLPPLYAPWLLTPEKQAPKPLSFPAMTADPLLWGPAVALFQQQLAPTPASAGATRSTGRAGGEQRRGSGHHSPPKHPPPLFGEVPQQQHHQEQQQQHAPNANAWLAKSGSNVEQLHAGLVHWNSEVSANMGTLAAGTLPIPSTAAAAPPLMGQQHPPQPLDRLTSNLSSYYSACPPEFAAALAPAAALGGQLAKQKSDLADLAQLAEEEEEGQQQPGPLSAAPPTDESSGQHHEGQAGVARPPSDTASQEAQQDMGAGAGVQAQHSGAEAGKRDSGSVGSQASPRPAKRPRAGTDQQDSTGAAPVPEGLVTAAGAGVIEVTEAAPATQRRLDL